MRTDYRKEKITKEITTRIYPLGITRKIPKTYRVVRAHNANGSLNGFQWDKRDYAWDFSDRHAVEVRARNGRVVAAFAWNKPTKGKVSTIGTYVAPSLRNKGIASALWRYMVKETQCKVIDTYVISRSGRALAEHMKRTLRGVTVNITGCQFYD